MKVIGFKKVDFVTKENQQIAGYKVFCTLDDDNTTGVACESIFVSEKKAEGWVPEVGEELEIVYNKYGKIERVDVA